MGKDPDGKGTGASQGACSPESRGNLEGEDFSCRAILLL